MGCAAEAGWRRLRQLDRARRDGRLGLPRGATDAGTRPTVRAAAPCATMGGMEPDALPAAVAETHISVVFFNGSRAYKWCKPVDLGFIDLSTPARREAALLRELELTRRFAPDVSLDVVGLVPHDAVEHRPTPQRGAEATSEPQPIEHVLIMQRMPAD